MAAGLANAFELIQPQSAGQGKKSKGSLKGSAGVILQATSPEEKEKWTAAISQCKRELQAKIMAQINATNESKKHRASTLFAASSLSYFKTKDDDESSSTNDDEHSAYSDPCLSPRDRGEVPREIAAGSVSLSFAPSPPKITRIRSTSKRSERMNPKCLKSQKL